MGCCGIQFPWWLNLDWRMRRRVWLAMCAVELPVTVALLVLFGVADPDTYRTTLWAQGAMWGWNSSPQELLYAAANYRPISAPGPWNQTVTDFGVVAAVLSTFILIVKCVMFVTHTLPPIASAFIHLGMLIVWCFSASLQAASDYSDPAHPAAVPWFIRRGCGAPVQQSVVGYCQQAVGAFAMTIVEICVFAAYFGLSVAMAVPSKDQKARQAEIEQEKREWEEIENFDDKQFNYELDQMHVPMQTPMTFNFDLPAGQGVLADQQQHQPTQQFHLPGTPGARSSFGASIAESTGTSAEHQRGTPSNRDLPLRHHITSDVYA